MGVKMCWIQIKVGHLVWSSPLASNGASGPLAQNGALFAPFRANRAHPSLVITYC